MRAGGTGWLASHSPHTQHQRQHQQQHRQQHEAGRRRRQRHPGPDFESFFFPSSFNLSNEEAMDLRKPRYGDSVEYDCIFLIIQ